MSNHMSDDMIRINAYTVVDMIRVNTYYYFLLPIVWCLSQSHIMISQIPQFFGPGPSKV